MSGIALAVLVGLIELLLFVVIIAIYLYRRKHQELGTPEERAIYRTLHLVSLAAPHLRKGLTKQGATRAAKYLHPLLGSEASAITDLDSVLTWNGVGETRSDQSFLVIRQALESGQTEVINVGTSIYSKGNTTLAWVIVSPIVVEQHIVGSVAAFSRVANAGLVRATQEIAGWISTRVELAELDKSRTALIEAEVRALRAQISPHFIYNSLTAIASLVLSDPERARELISDFAEFTRYSFRKHGEFATLSEELHAIGQYLELERARFGDRLQVSLKIAPEVLGAYVPFLCLQPLVENAIKHGLEEKPGVGKIQIEARDRGAEVELIVDDDGVGMDPDYARVLLSGIDQTPNDDSHHVGVGNVDARMRQVYGPEHGLIIETALGAGTRVIIRIPKFHPKSTPHVPSAIRDK